MEETGRFLPALGSSVLFGRRSHFQWGLTNYLLPAQVPAGRTSQGAASKQWEKKLLGDLH